MAARGSGSTIDADARNPEFFMAGLRDGFNGLTKNTPPDRSVADATILASAQARKIDAAVKVRPTDIPPESRPEPEAATFNARLPMHLKKGFCRVKGCPS
jgi:hypothetical protein